MESISGCGARVFLTISILILMTACRAHESIQTPVDLLAAVDRLACPTENCGSSGNDTQDDAVRCSWERYEDGAGVCLAFPCNTAVMSCNPIESSTDGFADCHAFCVEVLPDYLVETTPPSITFANQFTSRACLDAKERCRERCRQGGVVTEAKKRGYYGNMNCLSQCEPLCAESAESAESAETEATLEQGDRILHCSFRLSNSSCLVLRSTASGGIKVEIESATSAVACQTICT